MALNHVAMDTSCVGGSAWRQLMDQAGFSALSITGAGIFTDAASEELARGYAFSRSVKNFRLYFGNGDYLQGAFVIAAYTRSGMHDGEETYAMRLESAGDVQFVAG